MTVYDTIVSLLSRHAIHYREYSHGPIYSYEDAERERIACGWTGTESKSMLMTDGKGKYFLFVTIAGTRADFGRMRELTGAKLSLASSDEVRDTAQCVPGNVPPFGLPIEGLAIIVDENIFSHDHYLFSPGIPDKTLELDPRSLRAVFGEMETIYI